MLVRLIWSPINANRSKAPNNSPSYRVFPELDQSVSEETCPSRLGQGHDPAKETLLDSPAQGFLTRVDAVNRFGDSGMTQKW